MAKEQVMVTGWVLEKTTGQVSLTVLVLGQLGRYHTRTTILPTEMLQEMFSLITPIETSPVLPPSPEETGSDDSADLPDLR